MIKSEADLLFYLEADRFALERRRANPTFHDDIWKYQILLRKVEFYSNIAPSPVTTLFKVFYKFRKHRLGRLLGFSIPANVFGPGLRINHYGYLVVHEAARIGMWCDIHQGVNIGSNNSESGAPLVPKIGSNVWIGPGAKLFGDIIIGDGMQIGANAVVNKSFSGQKTVGGVPARVISNSGTASISVSASKKMTEKFVLENPQFIHYFQS